MIAILSDIHGNLPALEAVVQDALSWGCKRFISLGDVVGYYSQPSECIDVLKRLDAINIMGNHDSYLVLDTTCLRSKVVARIIDYHKKIIGPDQLAWLKKSLPMHREGGNLFVHGGPDEPRDQYLYEVSNKTVPPDVNYLFSGHTHVQTFIEFGQKAYCNPGSVGQPRDGDSRAAYAILDGTRISLHRAAYDIEQTALSMKDAGFEPYFYDCLYNGSQIGGRIDRVTVIDNL